MKIAIRGGHVPKFTGASKFIDELTEDRKVKDSVIKYLKQLGCDVLDVTPPDNTNTLNGDLSYGVNKANNWGANLFISIHFNKAYDIYNGCLGSEVCVYSPFDDAQRVVNELAILGFKNRGTKNQQLLVINTAARQGMKASLLEVCFIDDLDDMKIYLKDKAAVAKAIADAFISTWKLKMIATTTEKVMFRSSKKVDPSTNIKWIKAGTTVEVINIYQKWLKIKYDDKTGYIVKSKTTF